MGSKTSKQIVKEQLKAKYKREIESMYKMFDQTIDVVKKSRLLLSDYDRTKGIVSYSKLNQSKIHNLDDVLEQLLSSFKQNQKYSWGKDIYKQFKKHFINCFEDVWPINKEQFYLIILEQCRFQTLDFQQQLEEVALQTSTYLPNRKSYQKLFFQLGAQKIQGHLPSSIIDQSQEEWSQDFSKQCEEQKALFNLNAINATIINGEYDPKDYLTSHMQKKVVQQQDEDQTNFLPLFLKTQQKSKSILKVSLNNDLRASTLEKSSQAKKQNKKLQRLQDARIQNSSLIMPQTIFLSRMNETAKQQISDLVKFYKQFGNALQRLFFSVSLISSPFKHFIFLFNENMKRKNIKHKTLSKPSTKSSIQINKPSLNNKQMQQLLYGESKQAVQFRHRRQTNNNFILDQIRDFTQAYAQFIWKYLELSDITQLKLGKMISIENLYGIVLKSVWSFVNFISDRGYQYEEWKIQQYYETRQVPNRTSIPQQKKIYLLRYLKKLKDQHNPQKYLKKVVIFYREASALGTCADDLLNIYEELVIRLVKSKCTRQIGLFRMRNVIQRVLKIDQTYSGGGQIGYSWTTWYILTEMLRERITGVQLKKNNSEISQMHTQPDQDFFYEEDLGIN